MRTTLEIDDKVLDLARERARHEGISVGRAISDLALQGLKGGTRRLSKRGVPVFSPPPGATAHAVTPEMIERYRDDDQ